MEISMFLVSERLLFPPTFCKSIYNSTLFQVFSKFFLFGLRGLLVNIKKIKFMHGSMTWVRFDLKTKGSLRSVYESLSRSSSQAADFIVAL